MEEVYTAKQKELMQLWKKDQLKRINLLEGSVRSGKTWISLVLWAFWVATMPTGCFYLMAAKTLTTLQRNVLELLTELVGERNFSYSLTKKEARLFGRTVYLEGVSDMQAENKIRGMTLAGAYCDEVSLFNEDFFTMLLSRLSVSGAKLFATTNPDNPNHWLKKKYIDRAEELDMLVMKFLIDDNTFLNEDYVRNLKKEYTGVYYDRFILGLWKQAEGSIYQAFAADPKRFITDSEKEIVYATVGVDFGGNKSANAFVCTGFTKGFRELVVLDEYYFKGKISPDSLEKSFVQFVMRCQKKYPVYDAFCDCAETTLIQGFKKAVAADGVCIDVRNAVKGRINDRIHFFNCMMAYDRFFISSRCTNLIAALENAVWDSDCAEDRRLDDGTTNVDSLDAMEYSAERFMSDMMQMT